MPSTIDTNKYDHEHWVQVALDILKPVTDGGDITQEYMGVEEESMMDLMEHIRELQEYLKEGFPDDWVCECEDDKCDGWRFGYDKGVYETTVKVGD